MNLRTSRRTFLQAGLCGAAIGLGLGPACARERAVDGASPAPGGASSPRLRKAIKYAMIESRAPVRERFQIAKDCGFEGLEIDSPLDIDRAAVVAAAAATGVVVHGVIDSVHWHKRFSDPDASIRSQAVDALRGAIADAKTYGATTVLVVPGAVRDPENENHQQVWERSQAEIRRALPQAREAGVRIAIEVVWNDFLTTPEQLVEYVDAFQDPLVGAYFDCSNMIKYGLPPAEWIRRIGPRLLKVDFKGYSKDKGWVAIGEGDEDWPSVLRALEEVGYHGWLTAEVNAGGREHLLDVSRRMDRILGRA